MGANARKPPRLPRLRQGQLRLANEATTPEAKTHFEKLAYQWMELATDLDQTAVLMAQWGGPTKEGR